MNELLWRVASATEPAYALRDACELISDTACELDGLRAGAPTDIAAALEVAVETLHRIAQIYDREHGWGLYAEADAEDPAVVAAEEERHV